MTQPTTKNTATLTRKETSKLEPAFFADLELIGTESEVQGTQIKGGSLLPLQNANTYRGTTTINEGVLSAAQGQR
jgi:autotransporter-associated beta strand protein